MALMRGYSLVDEVGRITFPANIRRSAGMEPEQVVDIKVLRIKGTSRYPHMVINKPEFSPFISPLEMVMHETFGKICEQGRITLSEEILEGMKLEAGYLVEIKVLGPKDSHWTVVYNRGPRRETTLQQRIGPRRRRKKSWDTQVWEY